MTPFTRATIPSAELLPDRLQDDAVFLNDTYQVNVRQQRHPKHGRMLWLSIKRIDKGQIHNWRDLQWIKNQIAGPDYEATEIFPRESRLIDTANQYHLWVFLDEDLDYGFFDGRLVTESSGDVTPGNKSVQTPFEPHVRPPDLAECEQRMRIEAAKLNLEIENNRALKLMGISKQDIIKAK